MGWFGCIAASASASVVRIALRVFHDGVLTRENEISLPVLRVRRLRRVDHQNFVFCFLSYIDMLPSSLGGEDGGKVALLLRCLYHVAWRTIRALSASREGKCCVESRLFPVHDVFGSLIHCNSQFMKIRRILIVLAYSS